MQIQYKPTLSDNIRYFHFLLKHSLPQKITPIAIVAAVAAIMLAGKNFNWPHLAIVLLEILLVISVSVYLFPLLLMLAKRYYGKEITAITSPEGLNIIDGNNGKSEMFKWGNIVSAYSANDMLLFVLNDKKGFFIPEQRLTAEEATEFMLSVNSYIKPPVTNIKIRTAIQKSPPYWMGFLCLIPLIGAFIGLALLLNGIFKYKNYKLALLGLFGIAFTLILYTSLYQWSRSESSRLGFKPIVQSDLNILLKEIEFYKTQSGTYPDSLMQMKAKDQFLSIYDPLQQNSTKYHYKKQGDKYYLFSVGLDGVPFSADDVYPQVNAVNAAKLGLILKN